MDELEALLRQWLRGCCRCRAVSSSRHGETCPVATVSEADLLELSYVIDEYTEGEVQAAEEEVMRKLKEEADENNRAE